MLPDLSGYCWEGEVCILIVYGLSLEGFFELGCEPISAGLRVVRAALNRNEFRVTHPRAASPIGAFYM